MTDSERGTDVARRTGLRAFNKTKTFFNDHDMILEKIDQESDIGIDAILTLFRRGRDAGRYVNLQIKGGQTYKRKAHVDDLYSKRRGMVSLRSADWKLWKEVQPSRGYEGHHIIDVDERLKPFGVMPDLCTLSYKIGRWVGLGYDDKIMTGWGSMGKSQEDAEATIAQLNAEHGGVEIS